MISTCLLALAQEQSFTRAAARLGVSLSALSHAMSALEERLGVRLLARTSAMSRRRRQTSVDALDCAAVRADHGGTGSAGRVAHKPSGTIRVSCTDDQIELCLRPKLAAFLSDYPDITLEFYVDYGFTNVVEQRFDAGIRMGEAVSKDMIATRIGPDWRLMVVGSPAYFARNPAPATPYGLTGALPA